MSATNTRHSLLDDAQALLTATLFISLGITLYKQTGLLTGGTAGLAFLVHYATGTGLGLLFFLINLPFYGLAWFAMVRIPVNVTADSGHRDRFRCCAV
jgi:uncharacterized membrane-anchored protein YitT (DUF2179 family)